MTQTLQTIGKAAALLGMALALWGCSTANSDAPANDPSGKHPATWVVDHRAAYRASVGISGVTANQCTECHGTNLQGGISKVNCFRNDARCHASHGIDFANISTVFKYGTNDPRFHGAFAKQRPGVNNGISTGFAACQACHGTAFTGGTFTPISCLQNAACHGLVNSPHPAAPWRGTPSHNNTDPGNAPICGQCHAAGNNSSRQPATTPPAGTPFGCFNDTLCHATVGHPPGYSPVSQHGQPAKTDLTNCQTCHAQLVNGIKGGPGSNPRFTVALGPLVNGCEDCHPQNMAHPPALRTTVLADQGLLNRPWYGHNNAGNLANACVLCHGVNLGGGVAPACNTCHVSGSPLTSLNCTSCHGNPPNGISSPNRAGSHAKHIALATVTCSTCHNGYGSPTQSHYTRVDTNPLSPAIIAFSAAFNAKGATASSASSINGITCANVSCHGGQTTPLWGIGSINVAQNCVFCHQYGTTQYNSFATGPVQHHSGVTSDCTLCHDTVKLAANHFTHLDTQALEGPASATIQSSFNYTVVGNVGTCNSPPDNNLCHPASGLGGPPGPQQWKP